MNMQVASSLMHHLGELLECPVGQAPEHVQQRLEGMKLPMDLLRLLQWNWLQKDCRIGPVEIMCAAGVGTQTGIENWLAHQLLPVGSAGNGDEFVVDFSQEACPVGYVTHEEYDGATDPRRFFQPGARSIESFLYRITEMRYFPVDYYAAADFNQFLREEAEHHPFPPYQRKDV